METYINQVSQIGRCVICIGSGNEGSARGHYEGQLVQGAGLDIQFSIGAYESAVNLQIWKDYSDIFTIELINPEGNSTEPFQEQLGVQRFLLNKEELFVYYGKPSPYSIAQEIYLDFLPREDFLTEGLWIIRIQPRRIVNGRIDLWLPGGGILNANTGFYRPVPDTTLTIPSASQSAITVGAYDSRTMSYAPFSGRGFTRRTNQIKPELVAPGVDIVSTKAGGGYESYTGTSFATPYVTGAAALLMEWGIINGNDAYLYGEKVKAYLVRGARQLPGVDTPNPLTGWGALCARESLPV